MYIFALGCLLIVLIILFIVSWVIARFMAELRVEFPWLNFVIFVSFWASVIIAVNLFIWFFYQGLILFLKEIF